MPRASSKNTKNTKKTNKNSVAAPSSSSRARSPTLEPIWSDSDVVTPFAISATNWNVFLVWTAFWWSLVVVWAALFYVKKLDFATSTRLSLYGICVWLNALLIPFVSPFFSSFFSKNNKKNNKNTNNKSEMREERKATKLQQLYDITALWTICYTVTNVTWELPFVFLSRFVYGPSGLKNFAELEQHSAWMRESPLNMWFWVLSSFGVCDLRTINHNGTFYSLELLCFVNIFCALIFFWLNQRGASSRFLLPILMGGVAMAATWIFSVSEVFDHYANVPPGKHFVWDALLALVWTQYQYVVYPVVCALLAIPLLREDWKVVFAGG